MSGGIELGKANIFGKGLAHCKDIFAAKQETLCRSL
jgi:hypothetical protein